MAPYQTHFLGVVNELWKIVICHGTELVDVPEGRHRLQVLSVSREICIWFRQSILLHHHLSLPYFNPISEVSAGMTEVYLDPAPILHPLCNSIIIVRSHQKVEINCATGSTPDNIPHNATIMTNNFAKHIHHVPLYWIKVIILMLISPMFFDLPWWWSFNIYLSTLDYIGGPLKIYFLYISIYLSVIQ